MMTFSSAEVEAQRQMCEDLRLHERVVPGPLRDPPLRNASSPWHHVYKDHFKRFHPGMDSCGVLQKLYGLPPMGFLKRASDGERRYRASQYRGTVIDLLKVDAGSEVHASQEYKCRRAMSIGFMQHELDFIAAADYLARRRSEFLRVLPPGDPARFDEGAIRILEGGRQG